MYFAWKYTNSHKNALRGILRYLKHVRIGKMFRTGESLTIRNICVIIDMLFEVVNFVATTRRRYDKGKP